jgi:hypothetical protein
MEENSNKLVVLWISGDKEVAELSCLMYTHAAIRKKWFNGVTLMIWGPSAGLLAADSDLQEKVIAMQEDGVVVEACETCTDMLGVTEELEDLGIDVKFLGESLTGYLKKGYRVVSY